MKQLRIFLFATILLSSIVYSQKDTVWVPGYNETSGKYGTLNDVIDSVKATGDINNTVFVLKPYEKYVLNKSIFINHDENLEIVAPEPGRTQEKAPPQIVWTDEKIEKQYIIRSYGDIVLKNVWVRYADILGNKVSSSIVFEDQEGIDNPEVGFFDGCILDYAGIGAEGGGSINVKSDHFNGEFYNCYWRNNSDSHFRYYGRAVSFPYQSTGWHYDKLLFENCSFSNISRIVMMEGNEYGSNIHLNHCTILNTVEWIIQSGWIENLSITNSIFVNPCFRGYRAIDFCLVAQSYEDFLKGECDKPNGGLFLIEPVDSFGFDVDFTDHDRKIFIGNNSYVIQDWMVDWYTSSPWAKDRIKHKLSKDIYNPYPMIGQDDINFIDSLDVSGKKVFKNLNVDWSTIHHEDPNFLIPATNMDTLKLFVEEKWSDGADFDWSYKPEAGRNQIWPLPENLSYSNNNLMTAALGGFPLGDLIWYPDQMMIWITQ